MTTTATVPTRDHESPPARRQRGLWLAWIAFWALMACIELFGELRSAEPDLLRPQINNAASMVVATALILGWDMQRQLRLDGWLSRPLQWGLRAVAPLPLLAPLFVALNYALRFGAYALLGRTYMHAPWAQLIAFEVLKFSVFYLLFTGVVFGLRSHHAWHEERLNAERMRTLTTAAQLAQMTQQMQPHFLFNALNTISSLMHSDVRQADALLSRLAQLLRAATDAAQRPQQPLANELALLRAYAELMLARFGERADMHWDIAEDTLDCLVPTLGLQPLVENAFRHVVERRRARTTITVRARRDGARLCIEVLDDGGRLDVAPVFRVGLGNLQRRLQVLHGEGATLALAARVDAAGVSARVELPCAH